MTWWQQLGLISGTIIAVLTLLGLAAKGIDRMWTRSRKFNRWLDTMAGDKEQGIPSLMERVQSIERTQTAIEGMQTAIMQRIESIEGTQAEMQQDAVIHQEWHGGPGGQPARSVHPKPNGGAIPPPRRR